MDFLDKITIIIPPHNRPKHLRRILAYYAHVNPNIVIVDSSEQAFNEDEIKEGIKYIHLPKTDFATKVSAVLDLIITEYVMLLAEDDFYPESSLKSCIEFLEKNKDYSSCQGNYLLFNVDDPTNYDFIYYNSFERDIGADSVFERLQDIHSSYIQLFYSIHRKVVFKEMFEFMAGNVSNMFGVEYCIAMYSILYGKHKVLNTLYGVRENLPESVGRKKEDFKFYASNQKYEKEFNQLIDELAIRLKNISGESLEVNRKMLCNMIDKMVSPQKASFVCRINRFIDKSRIRKLIVKGDKEFESKMEGIYACLKSHPTA